MVIEIRYTMLRSWGVYPPILFRTFSDDASVWRADERVRRPVYYRDRWGR